MPKQGFRSITVAEDIYERFHDEFERSRPELERKGIKSFAAFVSYTLEERLRAGRDAAGAK